MISTKSIEQELQSIVGNQNLRAAVPGDVVCGVLPQFVAEPENERQLAAALAFANHAGIAVVPRGGGTKMDWGNPPKKAELVLSTARLNRILEHVWADLTVTVEAGCTLQSLRKTLAQHGQRLAFDGLWPEHATIGGVLSTNDSGTLRMRFGALRDLIIGVTLALPDGTLASSGGKVVKNVAGYDLPKLSTGALGTLGIITRAVFRLHPQPRTTKTFSFAAENVQTMQRHVLTIQNSQLAHTALQIRWGASGKSSADVLFEATDAGLAAQELHLRELLGATQVELIPESIWKSRQALWNSATDSTLLAKISVLPADFAETFERLASIGNSRNLQWQLVVQATGVGLVRLEGGSATLSAAAKELRTAIESRGGSLVILRRPPEMYSLDAWGNAGDAVPLMRAVKRQLDPNATLNPGRFVGGI
ncbi:MAG TPA: FAD-binding oxidoreductase [Candidatus Acidoferrum sp.]|nr:FAD-binding oxidoreductase [Candidatus Acidoferrum sp.]